MQSAFGHIRHRERETYVCNLVTNYLMRFTTLLVAVTARFLPGNTRTILFRSTCHAFAMKVRACVCNVLHMCPACSYNLYIFLVTRVSRRWDLQKMRDWSLPQKLYFVRSVVYFRIALSFLISFCIIYLISKSGFFVIWRENIYAYVVAGNI